MKFKQGTDTNHMTVKSIPFGTVLSSSHLFNAYLDSFANVSPFYVFNPKDDQIWRRMMKLVDGRDSDLPRAALSSTLVDQNQRFGADEKTIAAATDIGTANTYTVMTGQQVGLFTGPLYTIYKALTAVKLAHRLEKSLQRRVVPIFWMASDDHDFDEINHVFSCPSGNEIVKLTLSPDSPIERRSAAHIPFGSGITELIDRFADTLNESEFKHETVSIIRECCTPENTLSHGFARLLTRLFRGTGLVLVDPTDPQLKPLMKPVFTRELRYPLRTTRSVLEAGEKLKSAGFQPQVDRDPESLNLFLCKDNRRAALMYQGGEIRTVNTGVRYTVDAALALVGERPESFSHNVITRPIVQDSLFPALAYVGGPSEIAYFAQLKDVYSQFGLPFPIVYPRSSMTIVDRRIQKVMDNYELSVEDFFGNVHHVISQRMQDEIPDDLISTLQEARASADSYYGRLTEKVSHIDVNLRKVAESAQRKAEFELSKLEDKTLQAVKRTHKTMRQQIEKAEYQLYPRNQPQERVLNIWPFISVHGFDFMNKLLESVDDADFSHRIVSL